MPDKYVTDDMVLEAIEKFRAEIGVSPSVRELGERLGLKSPATVQHHLERLIAKGKLKRFAGKARTLQVVELGESA